MASLEKWIPTRFVFSLLVVICSFLNVIPSHYADNVLSTCQFDAIYQFGDSISDTGNYIQLYPTSKCANPPYGATFFKRPTGRCSNGMIILDFLALSAELPFVEAYLTKKDGLFYRGVNFAASGATALPADEERIQYLSKQVGWMASYFDGICSNDKDCLKKNERALFVVGEIGANDYKSALWAGKTLEEVKAMVPRVVQAIKYAVKKVIEYGATRMVVPGSFPIGCLPVFLNQFQTNDSRAYDDRHCLKDLNNLAIYHNDHLQQAIEELKEEHPNVIVVYGNLYDAFQWLYSQATLLGFDPKSLQKACCGVGGEYNMDYDRQCGLDPTVTVCPNPDELLNWDGPHLTQRAYEFVTAWLIRDIYPKLQCNEMASYSSAV